MIECTVVADNPDAFASTGNHVEWWAVIAVIQMTSSLAHNGPILK